MVFGNRIGNKVEHNSDGHEETKWRSTVVHILRSTEWLILLLVVFTIILLILLNCYAYQDDDSWSNSNEMNTNISTDRNTHPTTLYFGKTTQRIDQGANHKNLIDSINRATTSQYDSTSSGIGKLSNQGFSLNILFKLQYYLYKFKSEISEYNFSCIRSCG